MQDAHPDLRLAAHVSANARPVTTVSSKSRRRATRQATPGPAGERAPARPRARSTRQVAQRQPPKRAGRPHTIKDAQSSAERPEAGCGVSLLREAPTGVVSTAWDHHTQRLRHIQVPRDDPTDTLGTMEPKITRINPDQLHRPPGYHHVTMVHSDRMAYLAGQCPLNREGDLVRVR